MMHVSSRIMVKALGCLTSVIFTEGPKDSVSMTMGSKSMSKARSTARVVGMEMLDGEVSQFWSLRGEVPQRAVCKADASELLTPPFVCCGLKQFHIEAEMETTM
jgi:hypothetical protein